MTDQGKPTNTVSVKMLSTRAGFREAYLRTLDENETLKAEHEQERLCLQAEIDAADQRIRALKTERDSLIADVRSALHAIEHEGPRLAALRVMEEKQKAEAALAEARPLLEAVDASAWLVEEQDFSDGGEAIKEAALAYLAKKAKKEGE